MHDASLRPRYEDSHALVIGINDYKAVSPLQYAVSDAEAVAEVLKTDFAFPADNVHLLVDQKATRARIMRAFTSFASGAIPINDRLVVFFAGHGHTVRSRTGDVGFLVRE